MAEKSDVYVLIHRNAFVTDQLAPVKYIFVDSQKEKAIDLRDKLDAFKDKFDRDLLMEVHIAQTKASDKRELEDLMRTLGVNRLPLRKPCMEGTRAAILQKIENEIKNVDGPNMIWIRGSPGVGKSALAASIANGLEDQKRRVIPFRFDRTKSTMITTNALWRAIACDLARLYPFLQPHLTQGIQGHNSSDIDRLFRLLIEEPLSTLGDDVPREELPVIVIDALDECGGLRHDASGKEDLQSLLHTLKCWIQAEHLKKFKLVITSRPEGRITIPDSASIHEIPSGSNVKPGDSAFKDIRALLKSRLEGMGMKRTLIGKALDYLVPRAAGIFIWATTVANFLERDPEGRFAMLEEDDRTELDGLHSLYSTIVEASFGQDLKGEEPRAVISVMGAMIFAKQPLDDALIMLPGVKIPGLNAHRLGLIRKGLVSVIDSGPVLRFHHRSFEDFLLSPSFLQQHPNLSAIQNQAYHEHQLTVLCLKTLVSPKLHFNMCSLESSIIKNADIQATAKTTIPLLVSYSCQNWADHLVNTPSDETLMEAVKFVIYEKLLFWLEAMSLLGKTYEATLILRRVCLQFIPCNTSLMLADKTLNSDHELALFIRDALRLVSAFIIPISQCGPQIYISSLAFAPEQSLVAKKFRSCFPNTLVVIEGRPSQWPMVVFTAEHHKDRVHRMVFSPDESTFASISTYGDRIICFCDSETGHCISGPFKLPHDEFVYDACFSPYGRHILLKLTSYAVVLDIETGEEQFRIEGWDFVFIHHDRKIASIHWIGKDGTSIAWQCSEDEGGYPTRIVVELWDASSGTLICNRLFEVNDVFHTRLSPDGRFLAVARKSENVIELWNLEDGKDPRQFSYPPGHLKSLFFSPTSDSLVAVSLRNDIYLWRLKTQEMASFSHDFTYDSHIIHSPLTNYVFIQQGYTVEIWDVCRAGSKLILETNPPTTSPICSTRPSRDGHRLLVGCWDGSVRMLELDLENLAMNQADTMVTQADADIPQFAALSRSGNMVVTKSKQSHSIEFLSTTTGEVISDMNFADDMEIAFSPNEDQVAFWSGCRVIICDIMHPNNCVSFNPWPRNNIRIWKIAFQTCNDLVICASDVDLALLQVWHRQGPAGFECVYSLDLKPKEYLHPLLAPDGLTVLIVPIFSSAACYSWNHDTAQFHPVDFDDQAHICCDTSPFLLRSPVYSPNGRLFAYWSHKDSHVRVWDTRTRRLISKFPTSRVYAMALSPALIEHSPGNRLIAVWFKFKNTIHLLDIYTGHLYAKILGQGSADMAFIRDGTKLASYSPDFGLRI